MIFGIVGKVFDVMPDRAAAAAVAVAVAARLIA